MTVRLLSPTSEAIDEAARILAEGGLVALPTETVYGLAADAANPDAVARLYAAKGRPSFNPLIAHVASLHQAQRIGRFTPGASALAEAFWPGPLTLVVDLVSEQHICALARAGLDSVALRVPAHPVAQAVISRLGRPIVAPSANLSGRISPTRATHVVADLAERLDLVIDGGRCEAGLESTIIAAAGAYPQLLRPGPVAADAIEAVWPGLRTTQDNPAAPRSPGQLLRHYAPRARLRLNATEPAPGEAYLGFGPTGGASNLSPTGNLEQAASRLFDLLRLLDKTYDRIAVAPIPFGGLGDAINDRLRRAAKTDE